MRCGEKKQQTGRPATWNLHVKLDRVDAEYAVPDVTQHVATGTVHLVAGKIQLIRY